MPPATVDDKLRELIEPLLRLPHSGRRRLDDRKVLTGIVFVLATPSRHLLAPSSLRQ